MIRMSGIIVNDTVMGGRSSADLIIKQDMLYFSGVLSLQNNGGFASIRRFGSPVQWNVNTPISLKVLGDGRQYQFRLRTNLSFDGIAYIANFTTTADKLDELNFSVTDFTPQYRGRRVKNAPPLSFSDISQFGFMLADKTPGDFLLKVVEVSQQ